MALDDALPRTVPAASCLTVVTRRRQEPLPPSVLVSIYFYVGVWKSQASLLFRPYWRIYFLHP
jgi:hypothetical protein